MFMHRRASGWMRASAAIRAPVGRLRSRWPAERRPGPVGWLGVGLPWLAGCPSCS